MKKVVIALAICLVFSIGVFASSGSAIIPKYVISNNGGDNTTTSLKISNITSEPIDVEVFFYKADGTLLNNASGFTSVNNALNFDGSATENTFTFSLNGNQSCLISFNASAYSGPMEFGYGLIKWNQNSPAVVGLVAHANIFQLTNSTYAFESILINQGQPF